MDSPRELDLGNMLVDLFALQKFLDPSIRCIMDKRILAQQCFNFLQIDYLNQQICLSVKLETLYSTTLKLKWNLFNL